MGNSPAYSVDPLLLLPPSARPILSAILCDREWVDDFPPHLLTDFFVESPSREPLLILFSAAVSGLRPSYGGPRPFPEP